MRCNNIYISGKILSIGYFKVIHYINIHMCGGGPVFCSRPAKFASELLHVFRTINAMWLKVRWIFRNNYFANNLRVEKTTSLYSETYIFWHNQCGRYPDLNNKV